MRSPASTTTQAELLPQSLSSLVLKLWPRFYGTLRLIVVQKALRPIWIHWDTVQGWGGTSLSVRPLWDTVPGVAVGTFVPVGTRSQVLQWGHSSVGTRLAGHPGAHRSKGVWGHSSPLAGHPGDHRSKEFWWPSMDKDIREFVAACSVCARNKASSPALWSAAALTHPQAPLEPHSVGFCYRFA